MDENKSNGKNNNSSGCSDRRKRVNQIKTIIIVIAVILLILPTLCCIILGVQVNRLQRQVDDLLSMHGQYGSSSGNLAYAADKEQEGTVSGGIVRHPDIHTGEKDTAAEGSPSYIPRQEEQAQVNSGTDTKTDPEEVTPVPTDRPENTEASNSLDSPGETDHGGASEEAGEQAAPSEKPGTTETQEKKGKYANKKVYLTFDDGPSIYTDEILDILEEYGIKATFFVVGMEDKKSKELYCRIVEEGHTLGMHSYSHKYSKIYNSVEDFDKDFTKLWKLLYDTTGYKPTIYRFPGGSNNMVNKHGMNDFIRYLNKAGIVYFDWNALNGDATKVDYSEEELINNVLRDVNIKKNVIVLMHDIQTRPKTVKSLPKLLDILISEEAQLLPLDETVPPIQMIKADTVK